MDDDLLTLLFDRLVDVLQDEVHDEGYGPCRHLVGVLPGSDGEVQVYVVAPNGVIEHWEAVGDLPDCGVPRCGRDLASFDWWASTLKSRMN
jgi:hypothetical protein